MAALTLNLGDKSVYVRLASADALCRIAEDPRPYVPVVIDALGSEDRAVAAWAAALLGHLDPRLEGIVPGLCKAARHPDASVRSSAALSLGQAGRAASEAVPILIELRDDTYVCELAVYALGEIGPSAQQSVPRLEELLRDPNPHLRRAATEALEKIR